MIQAVVFDKDGTLFELGEYWDKATVTIINALMDEVGLNQQQRSKLCRQLGLTRTGILANGILAAGTLSDAAQTLAEGLGRNALVLYQQLEDAYLDFLESVEVGELGLMEGVHQVLEQLAQKYTLAVITNDSKRLTDYVLAKTGLATYFDFVGTADVYGPKPNPQALQALSNQTRIALNGMVYVGDSAVDMLYGKHVRASIGLAIEDDHLNHLIEADYIIRNYNDLLQLLKELE